MTSISSSNSFSTSASTNKGMSGLVSGLDTEGMVESMLSGTQKKIDQQQQEQQRITWKQEMYRDIISQIGSFQNKFFDYTSSTNLTSTSFFNTMMATSSSGAVKVSAGSAAATGGSSIQVGQLATATKLVSAAPVSSALSGKIDAEKLAKKVYFKVNGGYAEIDLSGDNLTPQQLADKINGAAVKDTNGNQVGKMRAEITSDGLLSISAVKMNSDGTEGDAASVFVSQKSSALGLQTLGLKVGVRGGEIQSAVKPDTAATLDFLVDGLQKTITLKGSTYDDVMSNLQKSLDDAFGKGAVTVDTTDRAGGGYKFVVGAGREIIVTNGKNALDVLGLKDGQANTVGLGAKIKDLNIAGKKMQGDRFSFKINDVEFSFSGDDTLYNVIKKINSSSADVRITYNELDDKFTMERASTGRGYDIKLEQSEGNLLTALFGTKSGDQVASGVMTVASVAGDPGDGFKGAASGSTFTMLVNGSKVNLVLPNDSEGKPTTYTKEETVAILNQQLLSKYGYTENDEQALQFVAQPDGSLKLEIKNGATVAFEKSTTDTGDEKAVKKDLALQFGFSTSARSNIATEDTKLSDVVGLSPETITELGGGDKTLGSLAGDYAFEENTGRIVMKSTATQNAGVNKDLFGSADNVSFGELGAEAEKTEGKNALLTINGIQTERSSNIFTVGGVTYDLQKTTGSYMTGTNNVGLVRGDDGKFYERASQTDIGEAASNGLTSNPGFKLFKKEDGSYYAAASAADAADRAVSHVKGSDGKFYEVASLNEVKLEDGGAITAANMNSVFKDTDGKYYLFDEEGFVLYDGKRVFEGEEAEIEVTRDTDKIVEGLKSFVEEYNKLIEGINKKTDEEATWRKYAPLTSEQKKEMSDREVELWEEKSKTGLLRNDAELTSFTSAMRIALYQKPDTADYALYDIGIETSSNWRDKGKLVIDETKLRQMIEANPESVQNLFTAEDSGIANMLNSAIDAAAKTSSGSPGSLVTLAGVVGKATEYNNELTNKLTTIKDRIKDLQAKYEKERARYWRQFNTMEQALSNMNTQSSWLAQQFG